MWLATGRELSGEEKDELVAAACFMHVRREELARQFLNQDRCEMSLMLLCSGRKKIIELYVSLLYLFKDSLGWLVEFIAKFV